MCDEHESEEIKCNGWEAPNEGVQPLDTVAGNGRNFTTREFKRPK